MISVYLQQNFTQVIQAQSKQKNDTIEILHIEKLPQSYIESLDTFDGHKTDELTYLFYDIKEMLSIKRGEEIYLVLPDYYFDVIDCFRYETKEDIEKHIAISTGRNAADYYYSIPIITAPDPLEKMVTVCAIKKDIVDSIIEAANNEKVHITSIEPASISFLRASMDFSKEEFVIFGSENYATMIGYSSIAGMFKMDISDLGSEYLGTISKEEAENQINFSLVEFENVGISTFKFMNQGIPYIELMAPIVINSFEAFKSRLAERKYFPSNIKSSIDKSEQQDWMGAVGTLLQNIDFAKDQYSEIIDSYEEFTSANILPESIRKHTKAYGFYQKATVFCRIAVLLMLFTIAVESIGILFFESTTIPAGLQEDYDAGQQSIELINKEINLIALQKQEHEYPMEVFHCLLSDKPDGMYLTSIELGNESNVKNSKKQWIKMKVAAIDPVLFQDYIFSLAGGFFTNAAVTQINADNSGYKTADIIIGKGQDL